MIRQVYFDKRSALKQIIILSCIAIDKLDDIIYYRNILAAREGVNKAYFNKLIREAVREYNEVNERIHELNDSLLR